jgi:hypothetical protein
MALLDNLKRILTDDFPKDDQALIERLAFILNRFMDQVITQVNGNLDFSNLLEDIRTYRVTVNAAGTPIGNDTIKTTVNNPGGVVVVKAVNQVLSTTYPTTAPWVSFSPQGTLLKIRNIKGLQANQEYLLTLRISP